MVKIRSQSKLLVHRHYCVTSPAPIPYHTTDIQLCLQLRPDSANDSRHWTTNGGAPVWNNISSLTVGERGPVLLEDYHLVEKLANFDRERIPERVVHARGAAAKGFFEVTHDISHLTCADFLRAPGVQTPVAVRFSTVIHERGSPETIRDPRGFAVKFYTREGMFQMLALVQRELGTCLITCDQRCLQLLISN